MVGGLLVMEMPSVGGERWENTCVSVDEWDGNTNMYEVVMAKKAGIFSH